MALLFAVTSWGPLKESSGASTASSASETLDKLGTSMMGAAPEESGVVSICWRTMEGPAGPSIGGLLPMGGVVVTGVRWGIDPIDIEAVGLLPETTGGSSLYIR